MNPFDKMTPEQEAAYREYQASQNDPALDEFERSCENGWLRQAEYCPDVLDEMERQDAEGRS